MTVVNIRETRSQLSRLVDRPAKGDSFAIARAGMPIVGVVALDAPTRPQRLAFPAGEISVPGDFDIVGEWEIAALSGTGWAGRGGDGVGTGWGRGGDGVGTGWGRCRDGVGTGWGRCRDKGSATESRPESNLESTPDRLQPSSSALRRVHLPRIFRLPSA